jgi:hypothetical protein
MSSSSYILTSCTHKGNTEEEKNGSRRLYMKYAGKRDCGEREECITPTPFLQQVFKDDVNGFSSSSDTVFA